MEKRVLPIIVRPHDSIQTAIERMDAGPKRAPPSPAGIVLVMDGRGKLLGVATDGDVREAILQGKDLGLTISSIMTRNPVTVRQSSDPGQMLRELHREAERRGKSETAFHNVIVVDDRGRVLDVVTPFTLWRQSDVTIKTAAVIGLGYVGLTLALTLNEFGIRVIGIDANKSVSRGLRKGIPHVYEKGLENILKKHVNVNLIVKDRLEGGESDIYVICVGTPITAAGRTVMSHLRDAARSVGGALKARDLVILRSTVPIGTCRTIVIPLLERASGLKADRDFSVAFAPERTVEGKALEELRTLPQVIGGYNKQALDEAARFFQIFVRTIVPVGSLEEAETVKLLNNSFRDLSFAFANEVAQICGGFGLNARTIIRAANEGYPRNRIPTPSPGVGGPCLEKDSHLFIESAASAGRVARLPKIARQINAEMIDFVCRKVRAFCRRHDKKAGKAKIFLVGMAFKGDPETADLRNSTSVQILRNLQKDFHRIALYDPVASATDMKTLRETVVKNPATGFAGADCVLILNNHASYREWDIFLLANSMAKKSLLFDPWGAYSPEKFTPLAGLTYAGL